MTELNKQLKISKYVDRFNYYISCEVKRKAKLKDGSDVSEELEKDLVMIGDFLRDKYIEGLESRHFLQYLKEVIFK